MDNAWVCGGRSRRGSHASVPFIFNARRGELPGGVRVAATAAKAAAAQITQIKAQSKLGRFFQREDLEFVGLQPSWTQLREAMDTAPMPMGDRPSWLTHFGVCLSRYVLKTLRTRARIYAINVLKAQQERGKFDVHMQNKVKPLLGRRCFIPSQVVNMPVSAQAEFLNAGKLDNQQTVEGCILKSAGGGLVWVYIFAERMPFRFWMKYSCRHSCQARGASFRPYTGLISQSNLPVRFCPGLTPEPGILPSNCHTSAGGLTHT